MEMRTVRRWGVDFGNVLIRNLSLHARKELLERYPDISHEHNLKEFDLFLFNHSSLVPHAVHGLAKLIELHGAHNVWIVSRASGIERFVNRRLFIVHRFEELTGLPLDHIFFVDKREEKAEICKQLDIQGHIDDQGEVLFHLLQIVPILVWFSPTANDFSRWSSALLSRTLCVNGWDELLSYL